RRARRPADAEAASVTGRTGIGSASSAGHHSHCRGGAKGLTTPARALRRDLPRIWLCTAVTRPSQSWPPPGLHLLVRQCFTVKLLNSLKKHQLAHFSPSSGRRHT